MKNIKFVKVATFDLRFICQIFSVVQSGHKRPFSSGFQRIIKHDCGFKKITSTLINYYFVHDGLLKSFKVNFFRLQVGFELVIFIVELKHSTSWAAWSAPFFYLFFLPDITIPLHSTAWKDRPISKVVSMEVLSLVPCHAYRQPTGSLTTCYWSAILIEGPLCSFFHYDGSLGNLV